MLLDLQPFVLSGFRPIWYPSGCKAKSSPKVLLLITLTVFEFHSTQPHSRTHRSILTTQDHYIAGQHALLQCGDCPARGDGQLLPLLCKAPVSMPG